jgi:DNA-nicking Smr family endonuclease
MTPDDRRRRRKLRDDERALWHGVTRSIVPLKRKMVQVDESDPVAPADKGRKRRAPPLACAAVAPRAAPPKELPLAPLERRSRQRLARGIDAIDARIDLHGRTQSEAHALLLRFLRKAQANGAKTVLVITGKGGGGHDTGRGVLRRQVPLWLALPELRPLVLGFDQAGVAHGGEGALYVRLRRGR